MLSNNDLLNEVLAQMEERDQQAGNHGQDLTQDQLEKAEHDAFIELNEELAMAIIHDIRTCIDNADSWSLILCGARLLRDGLEENTQLLAHLKATHSEILDELAGDVVKVGFYDSPFKTATQTELKTLCMLFKE